MPNPAGDLAVLRQVTDRLRASVETVISGKTEVVDTALVVLLAEGHLLIEDVPGVGKTMLSKALARSIDGTVRRIQFTPDLLPSDVTGVSIWNRNSGEFEFRPGGVFANVVVGDEINRASPKTQSALLECMEERQVTVDNVTWPLEAPFMVVATQNPVEMEGTYALPEAQRDRFMAKVSMGYPVEEAELAMLQEHTSRNPLDSLEPVTDVTEIRKLIATVSQVGARLASSAAHGTSSRCSGPSSARLVVAGQSATVQLRLTSVRHAPARGDPTSRTPWASAPASCWRASAAAGAATSPTRSARRCAGGTWWAR
ncbi:AAA family ATPase [Nocardioides daphniae]|uniref:AAA family ATPase n=1 Tax=Nocardioides daphniae TaxID=402297 RepID=UPI0036073146